LICYWCVIAPSYCPSDIVFVLDASRSIGSDNFAKLKTFLSDLVRRLDIDGGYTRVGVVTFSSNVGSGFNLSAYSTVASVQAAISSLSYIGGTTNTAAALAFVRTMMLTSAAGDRPQVPNVVVVLSDGQSDSQLSTRVSYQYIDIHKYLYCFLLPPLEGIVIVRVLVRCLLVWLVSS